jgi:hypothetical protein
MAQDQSLIPELNELLKNYDILEGGGIINQELLAKAITELEKSDSENTRDISLVLSSNLNSFLNICHMLNQSNFLKQDSDEVFVKGLEFTKKVRERLRNTLDSKIKLRNQYRAVKNKQECLSYVEYFNKEFQSAKQILKKFAIKPKISKRETSMIAFIVNRIIEIMSELELYRSNAQGNEIWEELELDRYFAEAELTLKEGVFNLLKKVCFERDFNFEFSLEKMEILILLCTNLKYDDKIESYFDNFVDFCDYSSVLKNYEEGLVSFIAAKREETGLISIALANFTEVIFMHENKDLTKYGSKTQQLLLKVVLKAFKELMQKYKTPGKELAANQSI